MKKRSRVFVAVLSVLAATACFSAYPRERAEAATGPRKSEKPAPASRQQEATANGMPASAQPEAQYGPSFAYLAWSLFLQAMAPADGSLTFETWTEQCRLNPRMVGCPSGANGAAAGKAGGEGRVRMLHASLGGRARKVAGSDCSAMTTTPLAGYPAPSNLAPKARYCEEVFVSPAEAAFVKRYLTTLAGQQTYGKERSGTINFPGTEQNESRIALDSLEVKADWVPRTSYKDPSFACPDPSNQLYTETINGTCYALAAIHITSKVMPNWLWATFEPNSKVTNPNRCDPKLYDACFDPWGTTSSKPYGKGQVAQQSPELRQAMTEAHLHPAFRNYFLTGVQTQFVDNYGKPIPMGNSFVEFNQGVAPGKSSCITCHQYAAFDGRQPAHGAPEGNFGRPPQGWPSTGYACNQGQKANCLPSPPNATTQDFSWMLGLMPYGDASATAAPLPVPGGKHLPAQTHAPQSTRVAEPPKLAKPPKARSLAVADGHVASAQKRVVPEPLTALPAGGLAAIRPINEPPAPARVSWDGRGLEIEASNSSLKQILQQVAALTGARLEGLVPDQRIFGTFGPGPGCDVLSKLLEGLGVDVLMLGSRDADAPLKIVLSARSPAPPNAATRRDPQGEEASNEPPPEPQPDASSVSQSQPPQNPFGNGGPARDPLKFMQEILDRQHVIDQQQLQQQQSHPQP